MTVDTLSLAKELRAAELSSTQAEAIAAAIGRAVVEGTATKSDIQLVRADLDQGKASLRAEIEQSKLELRAEIEQSKLELRAEIERVRSTLVMWFIATNLTLAAIIIAVVKL